MDQLADQQALATSERRPALRTASGEASSVLISPKFVRAVLDDMRLSDSVMDALETRIVALEEVIAARRIRRWRVRQRLARSLRASVRHFAGLPFAEARYEAASTE